MIALKQPATTLLIAAGFIIWSIAFIALYGGNAVGCRLGWYEIELAGGITLQRLMLVGLYALSLAAILLFSLWIHRRYRSAGRTSKATDFIHRVARDGGVAAVAATLFCFTLVFWLSPC